VCGIKGVAARAAQRAFFGDLDRKIRCVTGQDSGPGVQHFRCLHRNSASDTVGLSEGEEIASCAIEKNEPVAPGGSQIRRGLKSAARNGEGIWDRCSKELRRLKEWGAIRFRALGTSAQTTRSHPRPALFC